MRPIRLRMQAFGPYPGQEVVDFRRVVDHGLFGIYGPTGSGKSTIFSALTFALFGEAAKPEQETQSLRSDLADPNMLTEVEFIFEVGERRYFVRRSPEQMRPKQRGVGETTSPHEAYLFDATGIAVEEISIANPGKVIAEKKTGPVRAAVTGILGYGPEQFRQIVLLPQGKFETFLAAKTDERLRILRELFDVSIYRDLASTFKEAAAAAEKEVRLKREVCAERLKAEGFETAEALSAGIKEAEGQHEVALKLEAEAAKAVDDARGALEAARKLEGLYVAAENARKAFEEVLATETEIASLRERVRNAHRAQAIVDVEDRFNDAGLEVAELAEALTKKLGLSTDANKKAVEASEFLDVERAREHEIDDLRRRCDDFARYQATLADATGLESDAKTATADLREAQKKFEAADRHHGKLAAQRRSQEQALKDARDKERERGDLNKTLVSLKAALKDAEHYEKATDDLKLSEGETGRLKTELKDAGLAAEEAKALFDMAEGNLAAVQALHLAAKLAPGEACPVCGSRDHPAPANRQIEKAGLDRAFREAKAAWEKAEGKRQKVAGYLATAEGAWNTLQGQFKELSRPDHLGAELNERVAAVSAKIEVLGAEIDLGAAEGWLEGVKTEEAVAETGREIARGELELKRQAAVLAHGKYELALSTVPEEIRELTALEAALVSAQMTLAARQQALKDAVEADRVARETAIGAAREAQAAKSALDESVGRRDKAEAAFKERLETNALTEAEFRSYKASIPTIESDTQTVDEYYRKLEVARTSSDNGEKAIAGSERPDLTPLVTALQGAAEAQKEATDNRATTAAGMSHLRNLQSEIEDTLSRLQDLENKTAPLRALAALFNAENSMRLDLETYAITTMFEHVLRAANQRLGPMTNRRYSLMREKEEDSGGRSRRGLGISVFDLHTGKARAPSTLSGGETFIAALALALGLSDVVESVNGKVHLDTIFIDEGFGSLDTENESGTLEQVLQVLTNLVSQRRAVGVISHVGLVQEVIPNGFYVRKELHGSRIEARNIE